MINAAIIGLGRWGQRLVESVQGKSDLVRFTVGVTRTPPNAAEFAARYGFPVSDDLDTALADSRLDAVVIASPNSQHGAQIVAAAEAKKHILVDKLFTLTKRTAEEGVEAAERAGVIVAAGHNRRFLPAYVELNRRLAADALGTLLHVEANMSTSFIDIYRPGMWRASRAENPAGGMAAMGIHMVDGLIGLFGRISRVRALSIKQVLEIEVDDTTSVLFEFATGMTGYLGVVAATANNWRLEAFGTGGRIEIRDTTRFEFHPADGAMEATDFPPLDTVRVELEAFARAIAGKAPYPIPIADVIHGIAVFEAIYRSAEASGKPVEVG
jgi:predicted dehydrogenase